MSKPKTYRLGTLAELKQFLGQLPAPTYDQLAAATILSEPPTSSTFHMSHEERLDGVCQMLQDLEQLATRDGCIAAAWALEKLHAIAEGEKA